MGRFRSGPRGRPKRMTTAMAAAVASEARGRCAAADLPRRTGTPHRPLWAAAEAAARLGVASNPWCQYNPGRERPRPFAWKVRAVILLGLREAMDSFQAIRG